MQEIGTLIQQPDGMPHIGQRNVPQVAPIEANRVGIGVVKTNQKIGQSRFAHAAGAQDGWRHPKR
jgi:hypothetical protein